MANFFIRKKASGTRKAASTTTTAPAARNATSSPKKAPATSKAASTPTEPTPERRKTTKPSEPTPKRRKTTKPTEPTPKRRKTTKPKKPKPEPAPLPAPFRKLPTHIHLQIFTSLSSAFDAVAYWEIVDKLHPTLITHDLYDQYFLHLEEELLLDGFRFLNSATLIFGKVFRAEGYGRLVSSLTALDSHPKALLSDKRGCIKLLSEAATASRPKADRYCVAKKEARVKLSNYLETYRRDGSTTDAAARAPHDGICVDRKILGRKQDIYVKVSKFLFSPVSRSWAFGTSFLAYVLRATVLASFLGGLPKPGDGVDEMIYDDEYSAIATRCLLECETMMEFSDLFERAVLYFVRIKGKKGGP
ncbi:hypothetical protein BJ508DRAFT_313092 [Ascobolus immersus RN42]|uniref:Uncharacterized protein n=1 Tax=Ascobolus immersus RN42 TaxID=1160509 RepID=A0A3N4HJY0_ASCIM|nr:hypothetical protein BJ508DRAFT_313092 [Ascobolus immersus RN42]